VGEWRKPSLSEDLLEIINDKALMLRVKNPGAITTTIPKSKHLEGGKVLVHWGLEEAQVLKNIGIKNVPSPITARYKWPGRYKPYAHQITTAAFFTLHRRAFCFSEMGTGKTMAAAWAADYLMQLGHIKRVLVVCPLSIMDIAWKADLFSACMHRSVEIAHGSADKRRAVLRGDAEFVIINYDGIITVMDDVAAGGFDLIICDEASALNNPKTNRWKSVNALLKPSTWLWLMTGTPAAQSPVHAYGLAKLVAPDRVPAFFGKFRDLVMRQITPFKWVPQANAIATVNHVLQPAIRFAKADCLTLPAVTTVRRKVPMSRQQEAFYEKMRKQFSIEASGEVVTAANAAVKLSKLLQIAGGAAYTDDGMTMEFDISGRYSVLKELLDEASSKVLVFVPYTHTIHLVLSKLREDGVTAEVIDGSVPVTKRADIFREFQQTDSPRVLIIQPKAAAHGVTLTAASTVVWWSPVSSVETYAQANARVDRPGQTLPCTVVQLEGAGVESHIYSMLTGRIDLHTMLIDTYNAVVG